ncbi:MAG TPA: diguanylate cyclase [Blastocatellia bacterium]|nr:diguanylate cyclase [Blastocatellia bacterium]
MSKDTATRAKTAKEQTQAYNSLVVWLRLQRSLASKNNLSLTTVSRDGAVIGRIENDNSICRAMRVSPEHAKLCAADCSKAFAAATAEGSPVEYQCHAGLRCFAIPVRVDRQQLVVLGGRAFARSSEYADFLVRYADMEAVQNGDCLKNIHFASADELRAAADLVASTVNYHFRAAPRLDSKSRDKAEASPDLLDAHLEIIRLTDQLESKKRSIAIFYEFLREVASSIDSQKVYISALRKLGEILKSERSSLMIFNEQSNELALEAAVGASHEAEAPVRVKLGEPVSGAVLASGAAMLVHDASTDARVPQDKITRYRTKSFISYPITLGERKIGVINLTDRTDGSAYESEDLSFMEMIAPHIALLIDRTEWHKKAEAFQRQSLTDALTGLPNRRYLEDRLFEEVERSKRYSTPLSFMLIDVDHFKRYNDIYGHTNADLVLVKTASILRRSVRAIDMSARFAGDEFCIVLPETELAAAARIAERLRRAVNEAEYRSDEGELMGVVTLSIGVSSFSPSRQSPLAIIETADRALYQAKTRGRNCVAVYSETANKK